MVFVFYQFVQPPMIFKADDQARGRTERGVSAAERRVRTGLRRAPSKPRSISPRSRRRQANFAAANDRMNDARKRAGDLVKSETGKAFNDVNYVFPTFVTTYAPTGVIGLIIAAIFAAAMSSISAGISGARDCDRDRLYRRHFRHEAPTRITSRCRSWPPDSGGSSPASWRSTPAAGVIDRGRQQIRLVLLRLPARRLRAGDRDEAGDGQRGLLRITGGLATVAVVSHTRKISFLWYNVIGCVVVVVVGMLLSLLGKKSNPFDKGH